jgi:hypothetical protein
MSHTVRPAARGGRCPRTGDMIQRVYRDVNSKFKKEKSLVKSPNILAVFMAETQNFW